MKSQSLAKTKKNLRTLFSRSLGTCFTLSVCLQFLVCIAAYAQPPIASGDCGRNTLFFNSGTNVTTTITELSETTQGSGTWEAWVKKENWAVNNVDEKLFANEYDYPSETAFYISLHGAVGLHFRTGNTNGSYISNTSVYGFTVNSWHHLAATWSESGGTVTTTIYIDGVASGSITSTSTFDLGSTFYLAGKTGSYKLANGEMVEVRVWDVARTEQEIADNRNSILTGNEAGLVAYYPLDEAAGSTTATNMVSGGSSGSVGYLESDSWRSYPLKTQSTLGAAPSGATYNFGTFLLSTSKNETFTISNVSSSTIDLLGAFPVTLSGTDANQFTLDLTGTASSLAAGASTTFEVAFVPSSLGEKNATVTFTNVASCSDPYTINLVGTATDASLTYTGSGFTESTANDGSVTGAISITLTGDTFQDTDADNLLDADSEVTLSNIPSGLTPVLALNSATEVLLTLSGNATNHLNLNDVSDIAFVFDNSAFVTNTATAVLHATGPASSGLGINFFDATPSITYAGTGFSETATNNGTVAGSLTIILDGDTFQDTDADGLLDVGSEVILTSVPDGLIPKITLLNNSLAAETWTTTAVPDNTATSWGPITYGNGRFVAVTSWSGINGVISSPDGINWDLSYAPRTGGFEGIAYGNGRFVAAGSNIISSADGMTWTDTFNDNFTWYDVTYGNGLFVVVTFNDITHQVLTSPDGITWTGRVSSEQSRWKGVSYGNGTFVAVADGGTNRAMYSTDGINWTSSATSLVATRVTFGNGIFVATGSSSYTSTDGITWTQGNALAGSYTPDAIVYAKGQFVAVSSTGISRSRDGINWTVNNTITDLTGVAYGKGIFVGTKMASSSGNNFFRISGAIANLSFTGTANDHQATDNVADIQFNFDNTAFTSTIATAVQNATGPAGSGVGIQFTDNTGAITFGGAGFTEVAANDGSVTGSISITLTGDTFQDTDADNSLDVDTEYTIEGIPAGLTPVFALTSSTEATLTFTGKATNHQTTQSLSDVKVTFSNLAFANADASAIANATGPASTSLGITFTDNTAKITYGGDGFRESDLNDGSVDGSITFSLTGESFVDMGSNGVLEVGSELVSIALPAGLSPVVTLDNASTATLTLTGKTTPHQLADAFSDVTITFNDAAFSSTQAAAVANATGPASTGRGIFFEDNPAISSTGTGFAEAVANDGSVSGSISISLTGETFNDLNTNNELELNTEVTLPNLPVGLTPTISITENKTMASLWTEASTPDASWKAITYGNGVFVGIAESGVDRKVMTSSDGESWSEVNALGYECNWTDITYGNGRFVAIGHGCANALMTSPDGTNWTVRTAPEGYWSSVTYGGGQFVAVASSGDNHVITSPDGITWTVQTPAGTLSWDMVTSGNGLFVAIDNIFLSGDRIMTSPDGITWTLRNTGGGKSIRAVTFGNGLFVAVTSSTVSGASTPDRVITSPDGINWTPRTATEANYWRSVTYGNGQFVAVASSGTNRVMTSPDGITWTAVAAAEDNIWTDIVYGNGRFVAVSSDGTNRVMTSKASAEATLTLTGNALNHQNIHDVSDVTFEFADEAFTLFPAASVTNATGLASSGMRIDFEDNFNDVCAFAKKLTVYPKGTGTYTDGTTLSASIFSGSVSCAVDGTVNDVWYSFTTSTTGSVEINTTLGSAGSLSGAVYTSCGGESLYCVTDMPQKIYLPLAPNVDVYLQLWTSVEDEGTFSVRINEAPNTWADLGFGTQWSAGSAPGTTDDALILSAYSTSTNGSIEVENLELVYDEVLYGGLLEIGNADHLIVNGDLINNGGIYVESEGSLVTYGSISNSTYEAYSFGFKGTQIERNTTFDNSTGKYSIVGSPVEDADFSTLGSSAWVYGYDESELYNPTGNIGLDRYKTPAQLGLSTIAPGVGYFSAFTGNENGTISFKGTPNHGTIPVALSYTDQGVTEEEPFEGFNLVSNPYPAAISVASFFAGNSLVDMDATIYIWDDYSSDTERGTNADYIVINTMGTTSTNSRGDGEERFDGYVRSAQGFFVKANSVSQTLQFTDAMKVSSNNDDAGYFRKERISSYKLALKHHQASAATIVGYASDATEGKDNSYDASAISGGPLQLYSAQVAGDTKLAIQGLPTDYTGEVKLGYKSPNTGSYSIALVNTEEVNGDLWLYDSYTEETVNLATQAYSFTSQAGEFADRFVLNSPKVLGLAKDLNIYAFEKQLYNPYADQTLRNYKLYTISGMEVMSFTIRGTSRVDVSHLTDGVYIISSGVETKKFILK